MLPILTLVAVSGVAGYAFIASKMMRAMSEAPLGYEDETGFHYGQPTDQSGQS